MRTPNNNLQTADAEITEQTRDIRDVGPVENGVNAIGSAMTLGGGVISFIKPEIGHILVGAGAGIVIGGLAVGYAIRLGNG